MSAALYAAREGIETLIIERSGVGGQAGVSITTRDSPRESAGLNWLTPCGLTPNGST